MERQPVVVTALREVDEIRHRQRRYVFHQIDVNVSLAGLKRSDE